MKKKSLPIEWILLAFSFVITGIAILFVFKPPAQNFPKLIKWSPESKMEGILENSARRLFPVLAESQSLRVQNLQALNISQEQFQSIFKSMTGHSYILDSNPRDPLSSKTIENSLKSEHKELSDVSGDVFALSDEKTQRVVLKIVKSKEHLDDIETAKYFDSLNFEKVLKRFKSLEYTNYKFIFALFQTGKTEFTLNVIELEK